MNKIQILAIGLVLVMALSVILFLFIFINYIEGKSEDVDACLQQISRPFCQEQNMTFLENIEDWEGGFGMFSTFKCMTHNREIKTFHFRKGEVNRCHEETR